ncbi:hypothetical protein AAG906_029621 [Vitis piasezkii]
MLYHSCSPFHNSRTREKRLMHNLRQYKVPLQRYMAMMDLATPFNFASLYFAERNERLFYKLLIDNVEERSRLSTLQQLVRLAEIREHFRASSWSLHHIEILKNRPERSIQVIVESMVNVFWGLGILLMVKMFEILLGMGIPMGKLSLYTTLYGLHPSDNVGTNNEQLLKDEFYIGLKQRRAIKGLMEYAELLHEFIFPFCSSWFFSNALFHIFQFEDFANHNAFELLKIYRLIASLKLVGESLGEHTFLFSIGGDVGIGIAELIALEISNTPLEETCKKIWLVNSKGLIVHSHGITSTLQKPWAHEHEPIKALLDAIKVWKFHL